MVALRIDPEAVYSVAEAAALVPSPRGGNTSLRTMRAWIRNGTVPFLERVSGKRRYLFIRGADLLALLAEREAPRNAPAPKPKVRSPAQRRRSYREAVAYCEEHGL